MDAQIHQPRGVAMTVRNHIAVSHAQCWTTMCRPCQTSSAWYSHHITGGVGGGFANPSAFIVVSGCIYRRKFTLGSCDWLLSSLVEWLNYTSLLIGQQGSCVVLKTARSVNSPWHVLTYLEIVLSNSWARGGRYVNFVPKVVSVQPWNTEAKYMQKCRFQLVTKYVIDLVRNGVPSRPTRMGFVC